MNRFIKFMLILVICNWLYTCVSGYGKQVKADLENYGQDRIARLGCITDSECELGDYNQYGWTAERHNLRKGEDHVPYHHWKQ